MGTAPLACDSLENLAHCGKFHVAGVVTQPDRPKGRDMKLQPTPVKETALRLGLPVFQPERVRHADALSKIAEWRPDLIVVAAYGQILPKALLELPRFGCINVHASLLPKYRGAAPIQWAILNGDPETGVTIMKMDEGLDTGGMLSRVVTPVEASDNAQTLHDRLARLGADLLVPTLFDYLEGKAAVQPQPADGASYARKITKEDGLIDWKKPAEEIWRQVRGLNPWPSAFTWIPAVPKPALLKIWESEVSPHPGAPGKVMKVDGAGLLIGCGSDSLRVLSLQREGKRRMTAAEFLAGQQLAPGTMLA